VEAGWRLARSVWGQGYATEAALAVVTFGFESLALPEVLAVTAATNRRSQAVMLRIGMTRVGVHPNMHHLVQLKVHRSLGTSDWWERRGHPSVQDA
jgi:RimJ/RimL family protein N-acetyltransferase